MAFSLLLGSPARQALLSSSSKLPQRADSVHKPSTLARSGLLRYLSEDYPFPDESGCSNQPISVMEAMSGADWDNRIALQAKWSNEEKGWQVQVEWKNTPFGIGLFSCQDIPADSILRIGKNGYNLMQFHSEDEIEEFCKLGENEAEYKERLYYVKDYLWGYSPNNTNRGGYELSERHVNDRFFGMWIPGNGLNHSPNPNTVYRTRQGGTKEGIDLVALSDIKAGDELYDDYRRHGRAPSWLLQFAKEKQVTLNFADCNDFVDPGKK